MAASDGHAAVASSRAAALAFAGFHDARWHGHGSFDSARPLGPFGLRQARIRAARCSIDARGLARACSAETGGPSTWMCTSIVRRFGCFRDIVLEARHSRGGDA
jgi:hypothetical protein